MRRVRFLVWKELIELKEDRRLFAVVLVAPIIQLVMLGYAATIDIRHVPIVVCDYDRSAASRELIDRFQASGHFTLAGATDDINAIDGYLERGRAWMGIAIPAGYGDAIAAGAPEAVQVVADGSDANSANVALGYATNLIASYAQDLAARRAQPGVASRPRGIEARVRVWFNPRLESRDFMVPGVLALILLVVTANLSSMGIVREKETGTLEQLNVTPLRRWELIVGKLLPYALVGLADVFMVIAVALFWFHVPLRGSFALLIVLTTVYLLTTLGIGLLVSTISSTQQQAMMTVSFFFLMPMVYLSGFVFPIENMPAVIQWVTYAIPLRYFLVIVRAVFLKGIGLDTLWPQALALMAWGVGILWLAVVRSSKRLA